MPAMTSTAHTRPAAGDSPAVSPTGRVPIAFFIITKDEERNLPFSLASVAGWAREVFVLDSGSTDRTREVAEAFGARFHHRPWDGYVRQKNWGIQHLPITAPWVFILDADESVTPELRVELTRLATEDAVPENGFYVNRYFIFLGRRIRHCGFFPSWNIRLFRHGKALYEQRDVHEHMLVDGPVGYLRQPMEHYDRRGLEDYIRKHNRYSTLEAREMFRYMTGHRDAADRRKHGGANGRRRWIKHHVWPRLPARWLVRFVYMYVLRAGFLDGAVGFKFCLFMAGYEHQISLKLHDLRRAASTAGPLPA
ncbi:MAG: glycosyl transferase family 2 [Phycisphaerales bacterium]|nr:glycosyl transferase family 2 [Phycisphaerales bacterium]